MLVLKAKMMVPLPQKQISGGSKAVGTDPAYPLWVDASFVTREENQTQSLVVGIPALGVGVELPRQTPKTAVVLVLWPSQMGWTEKQRELRTAFHSDVLLSVAVLSFLSPSPSLQA